MHSLRLYSHLGLRVHLPCKFIGMIFVIIPSVEFATVVPTRMEEGHLNTQNKVPKICMGAMFLLTLLLLHTACSPEAESCKDAVEAYNACVVVQNEQKTHCYGTYWSQMVSEGLTAGTEDQQARINELYEDYQDCVGEVPGCETEEANMDSLCEVAKN